MRYRFGQFLTLMAAILIESEAFAQATTTAPQPNLADAIAKMIPMFAIVFCMFYFLVARPQQAKLKAHDQMLANLKKGDNVVTTGGIMGRVVGVEKDHILLEIASNVRVKVDRSAITRLEQKDSQVKSAA